MNECVYDLPKTKRIQKEKSEKQIRKKVRKDFFRKSEVFLCKMGTTTQAIINKSQDNENKITNQENDVNLENSKTAETATTTKSAVEPTITANDDDSTTNTTHISSNAKNECTTTETTTANITTSNEETVETIKILPKASPPPQVVIIPTNADTSSTVATNAAKKIRRAFSMPRNPFRWSHKLKTNSSNGEHKSAAGKSQDSGGGGGNSGGGGLSSITKSYTLSSCVGGKRERADSFVSLNSNDNYAPTKATSNNITAAAAATPADTKDTQPNHSGMTLKQPEEEEAEDKEKSYNINLPETATKSSNKKFSTKSNTINGVSTLTNSSTLPSGASLFSTLPAGATNNNSNNNSNNNNRLFRRSSFRKFLNRITQHMTTTVSLSN